MAMKLKDKLKKYGLTEAELDKIPIILYKNPNKKLLGVIGEVDL